MERVNGHLEKDGKPAVSDIMASFVLRGDKWDGQLIVPPGSPIEESDYMLVLDDGRRGRIVVNTVSHRHGQPNPDVRFEGRGPLSADAAFDEGEAARPKGGLYGRRKPGG